MTTHTGAAPISSSSPVETGRLEEIGDLDLLAQPSVCAVFQDTAARFPDWIAVRTLDGGTSLTWAAYAEQVEAIARGLAAMGIGRGDTVAYLLGNRPEFFPADLAALHLGAATLSVYQTLPAKDIAWAMQDSEAAVLFTEMSYVSLALAAREECPDLQIILIDGEHPGTLSLRKVIAAGSADFDFEGRWRSLTQDDLALLIYTSGTTSTPKCVELTHRGLLGNAYGLHEAIGTLRGARVVSCFPYAHLAERMLSHYRAIPGAFEVVCAPSPREIVETVQAVHPHYFFSPPRLFDKLRGVAKTMLADGTTAADILERFGFDQVRVAIAGGAPIPPALVQFWIDLGLPLVEGWGQTEGGALGALGRPSDSKVGTCGKALPGVELRLTEEGEILMRSPFTMRGYRNQPEKTAEVIDAEGWIHTGDIGRIDDEGNVTIVDRMKEIIISAGGKNMSPSRIESKLTQAHPLIGSACVVGNNRPYNVAVIAPDPDIRSQLSQSNNSDLDISAIIAAAVARANNELARVEQIKRFVVVDTPWVPGSDEVTPTLKLRRRVIESKYATDIELLYAGGGLVPADLRQTS
ncbi:MULTISPECIES: AMP-dependent synthetase/ligase [Rhodococcus]|jgi:long-subunit acyl-CoA synthetase (AMP-forming)|uniref:AMP-dependent synthetase/ligase n=1 Tax=Rhodococcus TaxID=1827 RepID=UPI000EA89422|nr:MULTISPECIES: AMP-dependent synthetase/ligase [Rhodococcus]NHU41765.1 long-chain fatty acid--CoA ligase [Rhodococcus sp. A14]MDI9940477.1 AMP-dependent synthetase/ligase [Rhodococcus sp. IEGM 1351]QZS57003.1 AMP-dependent synthetase/ligase [Rhodococcus opacus]RKM76374.1 long-chain fatty acid--CoA ligase [Rhodococcus opacus]WKN53315.1 AMP-dependent synthetase/ligase [Rhodococcus opacus]